MGQIDPIAAKPTWPWMTDVLGGWLFSDFHQKPDLGWDFSGVPAYPGQLTPDISQLLLSNVWNSWNSNPSQVPGMDFLSNYINSGSWMMDPRMFDYVTNTANQGGPAGYPLQLMTNISQYGGTGGPSNYAMSELMQRGAPSPLMAGPMQDIQRTGGFGDWGKMLFNAAQGSPPGSQYLLPFLQAKPYQAPRINLGGGGK